MDYDLVGDLRKNRANVSLFRLSKFLHQKEKLRKALEEYSTKNGKTIGTSNGRNKDKRKSIQNIDTVKSKGKKQSNVYTTLIGKKSSCNTPPFLLTFEIFNKNVHNCLVDFGASSNIVPYSMCKNLNVGTHKCTTKIVQLDRSNVKGLGELKDVIIRLSSNPKVHQTIDIIIVDILEAYALLLSRDWSEKLNGCFSTDWSHLWFPYNG